MASFLRNTLDNADAYRAAAMDRSNRGRGSGKHGHKVYATTSAMVAAQGGDRRTEGSKIADSVRDLWARMKEDALWNFRDAAELHPTEDIPW